MKILFSTVLILVSTTIMAASKVEVKNVIIRLPPPGSTTTAVFMDIINNDKAERTLEKVSGPISDDFELHEMAMADGRMTMRNVPKIPLKKGEHTVLKPGGLHIMVFNLKRLLKENEAVDLKLDLDHGEQISTKGIVKKEL